MFSLAQKGQIIAKNIGKMNFYRYFTHFYAAYIEINKIRGCS
ncbi:hypothetical protein HMPREF0027_1879, partial [Actinobacillus ureae ATCC 25976]